MAQDICIFCKIASGEIPSTTVYQSDAVMAFLDLGPVRPGHTLVIPKVHYENLLELPDELGVEMIRASKAVARALMQATGAEGFNLLQNNMAAAGQTVFHAHWHLIPRHRGDGLEPWPQGSYVSPEAMQELASRIIGHMN